QYFSPAEPAPAAPTNVAQTNTLANGSAVPAGAVAFSFTDNALNELRYEVQRSTDGGTTWVRAGTFEPIVSNDNGAPKADAVVVAPAPLPGNSAVYRVVAWNYAGIGASGASAEISSPPAADVPGVSAYYFNDQFWKGYPNGTIAAPSRSNAANDIIIGRDVDAAAVVPDVAFDWGMSSPVANVIQVDSHSTVHTGKIHITTPGTYIIGGRSDDDS